MILLTVTEFRNNISKYLQMAFTERIALKSKKGIIELTPSTEIHLNPSPSGDIWFDDARNMEELNRAVHELRTNKADLKELSDDEIKALFTV
jgi:hypothetical protein